MPSTLKKQNSNQPHNIKNVNFVNTYRPLLLCTCVLYWTRACIDCFEIMNNQHGDRCNPTSLIGTLKMIVTKLDVVPSLEEPSRFQWVDWYSPPTCRCMSIMRLHIQSTGKRNKYNCHVTAKRCHNDSPRQCCQG